MLHLKDKMPLTHTYIDVNIYVYIIFFLGLAVALAGRSAVRSFKQPVKQHKNFFKKSLSGKYAFLIPDVKRVKENREERGRENKTEKDMYIFPSDRLKKGLRRERDGFLKRFRGSF